ncbi:hypothetical protein C0Q70_05159 [Pomacea canaliculata]|uniref:Innexin n=1 Tax=Pomacea canaliculata TaxID=400727 RepID=A0A2T7PKI9_POMCA|nr:hypothetical protein C0Q70_05159 [Pomacea canaliculata]
MFRNDYSWSDKVASFWSTLLVASLAFMSLLLRYVTSPITCYGPSQMTTLQTYYYHQKCLQQEKYEMFSRNEGLPHDDRHPLLRDTATLLVTALKRGNCALALASVGRKSLVVVTCLVQAVLVASLFEPQLVFQPWRADSEVNNTVAALPREDFVCTFSVYQMGARHSFSVQCFLPINEVYSKVFTFLFYMFLLLTIVTGLDLLILVARVAVPGISDYPVRRYLEAALGAEREDSATPEKMYPRFSQLLGWDGRLVLALAADSCGPLTTVALVKNVAGDWLAGSIVSRSLAQSLEPHMERQSGGIPLVPMDDLSMGYEKLVEK